MQELCFCFFALSFSMRSTRPFTVTSVLKTEFPLTKKDNTSDFRVLANHLTSFFFLTLSGDSFGLLSWPLCPILYPTRSQSVSSSWLSFWSGFVTSFNRHVGELTYIPYSSLNGQSLRSVNSNTKGYWEIDLTSLISVVDYVTVGFLTPNPFLWK